MERKHEKMVGRRIWECIYTSVSVIYLKVGMWSK